MNENVRKVFDILGVDPNERFRVAGNGDILYYIDENLNVMKENKTYCSADSLKDLLIGNFDIIKLPKKKKLRDLIYDEFIQWKEEKCYGNACIDCIDCIFKNINCSRCEENCWTNHKDLYSDKFLDQEIEVE